ncbi:Replicase polyprotein 1a [Symbiodinium microadriaticum]|uniref:Replicase polyprotein 1a n=1 Tax=Symbiodinium microadriaticum TaxID=2951 RepID=A0A1Q9C922_SYMMI|nr:Replicase polyprotein 1a [Symbiodinium microadriaticum]
MARTIHWMRLGKRPAVEGVDQSLAPKLRDELRAAEVWASLRWSDLQAAEISYHDGYALAGRRLSAFEVLRWLARLPYADAMVATIGICWDTGGRKEARSLVGEEELDEREIACDCVLARKERGEERTSWILDTLRDKLDIDQLDDLVQLARAARDERLEEDTIRRILEDRYQPPPRQARQEEASRPEEASSLGRGQQSKREKSREGSTTWGGGGIDWETDRKRSFGRTGGLNRTAERIGCYRTWAQQLVNDDFVQASDKTEVDRMPAQGWIKCVGQGHKDEGNKLGRDWNCPCMLISAMDGLLRHSLDPVFAQESREGRCASTSSTSSPASPRQSLTASIAGPRRPSDKVFEEDTTACHSEVDSSRNSHSTGDSEGRRSQVQERGGRDDDDDDDDDPTSRDDDDNEDDAGDVDDDGNDDEGDDDDDDDDDDDGNDDGGGGGDDDDDDDDGGDDYVVDDDDEGDDDDDDEDDDDDGGGDDDDHDYDDGDDSDDDDDDDGGDDDVVVDDGGDDDVVVDDDDDDDHDHDHDDDDGCGAGGDQDEGGDEAEDSPRFAVPNWMRPELRCSDERKKDEEALVSTELGGTEQADAGDIDEETATNTSSSNDISESFDNVAPLPGQEGMPRHETILYHLEQQELHRQVTLIVPEGMDATRRVNFIYEDQEMTVAIPEGYDIGQQVTVQVPTRKRPPLERNSTQARYTFELLVPSPRSSVLSRQLSAELAKKMYMHGERPPDVPKIPTSTHQQVQKKEKQQVGAEHPDGEQEQEQQEEKEKAEDDYQNQHGLTLVGSELGRRWQYQSPKMVPLLEACHGTLGANGMAEKAMDVVRTNALTLKAY